MSTCIFLLAVPWGSTKFHLFTKFPPVILLRFWITSLILFSLIFLNTTSTTKCLHSRSLFRIYFLSSVLFWLHDKSLVAAELSEAQRLWLLHSLLLAAYNIGYWFSADIVLSLWVRTLAKWLRCQGRLVAVVLCLCSAGEIAAEIAWIPS